MKPALFDRRRALDSGAGEEIGLDRAEDPNGQVDPVVLIEAAILGVDDGLPHDRADTPERDGRSLFAPSVPSCVPFA